MDKCPLFKVMANAFPVCAAIVFISAAALGFAFFMQYARGLDPCHLCILQRWPYGLTALLGLAGALFALRGRARLGGTLVLVCALVFLGEAGLAFYHVGVERHWWVSAFESCTISFPKGGDLMAQIMARPPARCDEIAWTLLGLSMAGWNMILALVLSGLSAAAGCAIWRRNPV
jgi:disulfide bond formation protein DsbB